MRRPGPLIRLALGAFAGVAGVTSVAVPALAHEHPSGITDLVTPAVVRVEAVAHVEVTLLDHVGELQHVERSYEVPIGSGTGVVVNPEGAVVTLTRVVKSEDDAAVYAANKVFADHHKVDIKQDFQRHRLDDSILNRHLQQCYPPKTESATCLTKVTPQIKIFPNIAPADKEGINAEIGHTGDDPDSPAVLLPVGRADGGAGLPTAPLAARVPDKPGSPVSLAGFTGRPAADRPHLIDIAHLDAGGAGKGGRPFKDPEGKVDEPRKIGELAGKGLAGAPVIGDKDGAVVGLLAGGAGDGRMIGVREVTKALAEAKVEPRRGPLDAAFEVALTRFHTKYFGDAVPALRRVLDLYPGHVVAAKHLKTAQDKRGGPDDAGALAAPAQAGGDVPLWPFIAGAGVLVAAVIGGTLLILRRRARRDTAATAPMTPNDRRVAPAVPSAPPSPSPSSSLAPPPAPSPAGEQDPARGEPSPADVTRIVTRSPMPPGLPAAPEGAQGPPLLTARQPATAPAGVPAGVPGRAGQRFCTACGMGLGPAHRFCGYCGHPAET
ncbi:hypothetical protein DP939_10040 [Spongiactinospora rosea]|uniref:Trypsin-like peptidase n=1 Tax=Spongiactinospora rosea TaxID=2248750 RepID=A0A366M1T6_9ACTN|nr:hypothetical protein [Spongiactinospora rosea]RBQ20151.1 hypothetical protein DP939_10040 [Spongiactinospora rosea]